MASNQKAARHPWLRIIQEQRRSKAAAGADAGKDKSVDEAAFFLRDPPGDELIGGRVDASLCNSQRAAHGKEW